MRSKYSGRPVTLLVFLFLLSLPMLLSGQRTQENLTPLRNWATPLYWHPNQAERESAAKAAPQFQVSVNAVSTNALTFVAISPCRLVDTRGIAAGFNGIPPFSGPSIPPAGTLTIPVQSPTEAIANTAPAPCGVIPSIAQAYSLNLTVVPAAAGSVAYVTLWPAGSTQPVVATLNDLQGSIVANAAIVPAGAPFGGVSVFNAGPAMTDVVIDMNGYFAAPSDLSLNTAIGSGALANNTAGMANTANGVSALAANTTGNFNTAIGLNALLSNTTGSFNTASGVGALKANTTGSSNTASGNGALNFNTTGGNNTAIGINALQQNTSGNNNTASGSGAMSLSTAGSNNTALGINALQHNTTGDFNLAVGYLAGYNVSGGNSNNIHIGSLGALTDSGVIRLGTPGPQTSFLVAGVNGTTTGNSDAVPVVIDSNGQLGTVKSSVRFKEDIQDMGNASSGLLQLRPVTFRYRQAYQDGAKPLDYGLIAEEVAQVYPGLTVKGADGKVETVQYQKLTPMLLNELQKQHQEMEDQRETIRLQKERIAQQADEVRRVEARLAALEALLSAKTPSSSAADQ
jgi:hypothetical protein